MKKLALSFLALLIAGIAAWGYRPQQAMRCTFDRNELGPKGEYGQWYWEIYKCEDGTERRELVASPRG